MGFFGRTSKRLGHVRFAVLAMAVAIAPACHYFEDDDSGSSIGPSVFQGAWSGTLMVVSDSSPRWDGAACTLPAPCIRDLRWRFDANSNVTSVTVDSVLTNLTGSITYAAGDFESPTARFYDFELSDGATTETGGLYVEERIRYGIVVYSNGDFAVLEKSERSRPIFRNTDLTSQRTQVSFGVSVRWVVASVIDEVDRWTIETGRRALSGGLIPYEVPLKDPLNRVVDPTGNFTNFDVRGIWEGLDIPGPGDPDPDPYPMITIMSFDKTFAGTYECEPAFPECVFTIWAFRNPRPL